MKFISKNANLCIVLRPGLSAAPLSGKAAVAGIYVRFQDSLAEVKDEKHAEMMLAHDGFDKDFKLITKDSENDPFGVKYKSMEPEHDMQVLKHGSVEKNLNPKPQFNISPELKKWIDIEVNRRVKVVAPEAAKEMAKVLLTEALKEQKEMQKEEVTPVETTPVVETEEVPAIDVNELPGAEEVPVEEAPKITPKKRGRPPKAK